MKIKNEYKELVETVKKSLKAQWQMGHTTTTMTAKVYDIKRKDRQHERLKGIGNKF